MTQDQIIRSLRDALREIAQHPHCSYDHPMNVGHARDYGIGCADGHRCAASLAKFALESANVSAATRSDSVVADGVTAGETALYCSHCGTWMGDAEWLAKYKDTARCWQCASKGKGLQPNTECRHGVSIGDHCPDCEAMRGAEN